MPLAKPEERPGAKVDDIDRRTAYEPRQVDWTGEIGDYTYRAWTVSRDYRPDVVRSVVMVDGKPLRARRFRCPAPSSVYHEHSSIESLRHFLLGKVRRQKVPEDNSVPPSHPQWQKRLEKRRERRERWREPEVETEYYDGKAHHRLA